MYTRKLELLVPPQTLQQFNKILLKTLNQGIAKWSKRNETRLYESVTNRGRIIEGRTKRPRRPEPRHCSKLFTLGSTVSKMVRVPAVRLG